MISTQRRQDAIDIWCASVGLDIKKLRIVGRYPDFAMAIRAAVAGNGLLVVPFHIAEQDISAGHLVDYGGLRSEEHTSELQSLMRNSYSVFCLKKKTNTIASTKIA